LLLDFVGNTAKRGVPPKELIFGAYNISNLSQRQEKLSGVLSKFSAYVETCCRKFLNFFSQSAILGDWCHKVIEPSDKI